MDRLFAAVEALEGSGSWGSVLDAGTGPASFEWLLQHTPALTAVSAEPSLVSGLPVRSGDRVVLGTWDDPALLAGERFDVVIADYLLGAIEGHAPFTEDVLLARLRAACKGRFYVIGQEPLDHDAPGEDARWVRTIARLRDACILLAGDRPYREVPAAWAKARVEAAGFEVTAVQRFPIVFGARFVRGQLDVCRRKLPRIDPLLAAALTRRVDAVEQGALDRVARAGGLRFGEDWVIAARCA